MIRLANSMDLDSLAKLATLLWENHDYEALTHDFEELIAKDNAAVYLYFVSNKAVAFAQCQLRYDYVEGTQSSPVGYLEGIFVSKEYRNKGIARKLLEHCEQWATGKGCTEFASDCELTNDESKAFHLAVGFKEVNRIVCFNKNLQQRL